jgi:hypothetical protein
MSMATDRHILPEPDTTHYAQWAGQPVKYHSRDQIIEYGNARAAQAVRADRQAQEVGAPAGGDPQNPPDVPECCGGKNTCDARDYCASRGSARSAVQAEPVASVNILNGPEPRPAFLPLAGINRLPGGTYNLYAFPAAPQVARMPLTEIEIVEIEDAVAYSSARPRFLAFARAIEAAHGIRTQQGAQESNGGHDG